MLCGHVPGRAVDELFCLSLHVAMGNRAVVCTAIQGGSASAVLLDALVYSGTGVGGNTAVNSVAT